MKPVKKEAVKSETPKGIEISLGEIEKCINGLNDVSNSKVNIPATAGYWIGNLEGKLSSITKNITVQRDVVLKQYGEVVMKDGKEIKTNYKIAPENLFAYNEELKKLLDQKEYVEFKIMKFELFLDDAGSPIKLPQSFWSSVGKYFIDAPVE